jgi:putative PEP-CTERM system TPR-repeat lipoprotein
MEPASMASVGARQAVVGRLPAPSWAGALLGAILLAAMAAAPVRATVTTSDTSGFYEDALVRFNRGDYAGAIIQLKNVLQENPGNLAARILVGRAHLRVGAAAAAERDLELARKAGADEEIVIGPLAQAYLLQRKFRELLEKIVPTNRSPIVEARLLTARGTANYELLRFEEALDDFSQAAILAPDNPAPPLGRARVLLRLGRFAEAEELAQKAAALDSDFHDVWYVNGEIHRLRRRFPEAVIAYSKAIEKVAGHIPARIGRATALIDLDRPEEALVDLEYARRVDAGDPQAIYLHSLVLGRMGRQRDAMNALRQADQLIRSFDPKFVRAHGPTLLLAGVVANALDKLDDARFYLDEYLKVAPNHPGARNLLGGILIRTGSAARAVGVLRPVLELAPEDWQAKALLGTALMRTGKGQEAADLLEQAVGLMPDRTSLRTRLAMSHLAEGESAQAIDDLQTALAKDPKAEKPATLLGLVHLRLRQYDEAAEVADRMIESRGESPLAYNLKGGALLGKGDRIGARENFERALALRPDYKPAQSNLARLDIQEGDFKAARNRFNAMLEADPLAIGPMVALASIAEKQGDLTEAIKWLEKVGAFKKTDVASQLHLIDLYHRAGRSENALFLATRLKQDHGQNLSVMAAVGLAELKTGASDAAIRTFRRMANMRPDSAPDLLRVARLQRQVDDIEGAYDTLRRAVWVAPDLLAAQAAIVELEIRLGKLEEAVERAEKLRLTMPKSGFGERLLGDVMMASKKYPKAVEAYRASIEVAGENGDLAIRLYLAKRHAGDGDQAISGLESWTRDHPEDSLARRTLAAAYIDVGRMRTAISAHEKMLAEKPDDPSTLNNLAWLYHETGDKRALSFAEKAYEKAPEDAAVIDTLGWILVQSGQAARGLTLLREANARASRHPRIRYHMAVALSQLGRLNEARRELQEIIKSPAAKADPKLGGEARELLDQLGN